MPVQIFGAVFDGDDFARDNGFAGGDDEVDKHEEKQRAADIENGVGVGDLPG